MKSEEVAAQAREFNRREAEEGIKTYSKRQWQHDVDWILRLDVPLEIKEWMMSVSQRIADLESGYDPRND